MENLDVFEDLYQTTLGQRRKMRYTEEMLSALQKMEDLGKKKLLMSGRKDKFDDGIAFWTLLNGIDYRVPDLSEFEPFEDLETTFQLPNDLGEYIGEICSGDIDLAIDVVDQLIRDQIKLNGAIEVEARLQTLTSYLREVSSLIQSFRERKDRIDRRPPTLNVPKIFYRKYLPNWAKAGKHRSEHLFIDLSKGYCELCYKVCDATSSRCSQHIKTKKSEDKVRKLERHINGAFRKLGLKSDYYRNQKDKVSIQDYKALDRDANLYYKLPKGRLFKHKTHRLIAWAVHHPLHKNYIKDLKALASNYFDPYLLSEVNNATFEFLKEAAFLGMDYSHMNLVLQPFENIRDQYNQLFGKPFSDINELDDNSVYVNENTTVLNMLIRMSIFNLIELAYDEKETDISHLDD